MVVLFDTIDLPIWTVLIPLIGCLIYLYATSPNKYWKQLGYPDGPPASPFFGNLRELFDPEVGIRGCVSKWQPKYGRIIPVIWYRDPVLIVTDPAIFREIMVKDFKTWENRFFEGRGNMEQNIIKKGLFFNDGDDWRRIRRIISPNFSTGKLKLLVPYMNLTAARLAEKLNDHAVDATPASAKVMFGKFAMDVICGVALGLDTNFQNEQNVEVMDHITSLLSFEFDTLLRLSVVSIFPFLGKIFKALELGYFRRRDVKYFEDYISKLVEERKGGAQHADFLQLMLNSEATDEDDIVGDKKLTAKEIAGQGLMFLIAGYDTTSSTMQFLMYELARNPEVQEKMREEIIATFGGDEEPNVEGLKNLNYTEAVLNEILRMYPPVHQLSRLAGKDTVLNGRPVPKGVAAIFPVANIGRDPEFFPEPETFKPERFLGDNLTNMDGITFLSFGFGPRQCIGLRLALMEMKVALVHMLRAVKIVSATPEKLELSDNMGVLVPKIPIELKLELVKE